MAKDSTIIGLSIPYIILIVLTWITAGALTNNSYHSFQPWLVDAEGGILIFIGCLILIPVVILTIIFMATNDDACEKVAFGLGLPGLFLIIIGAIISLYYTLDNYLFPALVLVFSLPQLIFSFGLFARRNINTMNVRIPSPRRQATYPYQRSLRRSPQGGISIPNEVRIASTYGQSLKRCAGCNNTIDIKTRVCYFCGTRQPDRLPTPTPERMPPRPSPTTIPAMEPPSNYQRMPTPPSNQNLNYCSNCGSRVIQGHLFCTQCGASLD